MCKLCRGWGCEERREQPAHCRGRERVNGDAGRAGGRELGCSASEAHLHQGAAASAIGAPGRGRVYRASRLTFPPLSLPLFSSSLSLLSFERPGAVAGKLISISLFLSLSYPPPFSGSLFPPFAVSLLGGGFVFLSAIPRLWRGERGQRAGRCGSPPLAARPRLARPPPPGAGHAHSSFRCFLQEAGEPLPVARQDRGAAHRRRAAAGGAGAGSQPRGNDMGGEEEPRAA